MDRSAPQLVGMTLGGRYRVERALGSGGMGAVFVATQLDIGRQVALKVLFDVDPRAVARFRQEAFAAGSLGSPHVVAVYDFQTPSDQPPFLVMELLPGDALSHVLAREGTLQVARALRIASQVLLALEAAHHANILHRDIKPSNVWLMSGPGVVDHVKLLDFGIAKVLDHEGAPRTTTGSLLGSPGYLAPEQLRGLPARPESDLHAVGVMLFRMLTGSMPWSTESNALVVEVLKRVPPLVHEVNPAIPIVVSPIVARALAKDPDARFRSAAEMRRAIDDVARGFERSYDSTALDRPRSSPKVDATVRDTTVRDTTIHSTSGAPIADHPARFTNAAPTSWLAFIIVAGGTLSLGLVALATFLHARKGPSPSSSTTPTLAAADAGVPPSSAPSADLDASKAQLPEEAGASTMRPGARGKTTPLRHHCSCVGHTPYEPPDRRVELCTIVTPHCQCFKADDRSQRLCSVPFNEEIKCVEPNGEWSPYSTPTARARMSCVGYWYSNDKNVPQTAGSLDCEHCRHAELFFDGVPGSRCRGLHRAMNIMIEGIVECDP